MVPDTDCVTTRCTSSAVGPSFRNSATSSSSRRATSAGSTPGRTTARTLNVPTCDELEL
jgi:hypothetical protein